MILIRARTIRLGNLFAELADVLPECRPSIALVLGQLCDRIGMADTFQHWLGQEPIHRSLDRDVPAKTSRRKSQDRLAYGQVGYTFTHGYYLTGALEAKLSGVAGIQAQGIQHVSKIQSRSPDQNLDFALPRPAATCRLKLQILQSPLFGNCQPVWLVDKISPRLVITH